MTLYFNNKYKTEFYLNFPKSSSKPYEVNQNPGTGVSIEDPRTQDVVRGSAGEGVAISEGYESSYTVTFEIIGLRASMEKFFRDFFNGKTEDNVFSLSMMGYDEFGAKKTFKYYNCKFGAIVRQTEISQGLNVYQMVVKSLEEELEVDE